MSIITVGTQQGKVERMKYIIQTVGNLNKCSNYGTKEQAPLLIIKNIEMIIYSLRLQAKMKLHQHLSAFFVTELIVPSNITYEVMQTEQANV